MKVFLSWSGELSHAIAEAFLEWLPAVLQTVDPFLSSDSIDKGSRWGTELVDALESSGFGILFLTRENVQSPWVAFEAGALSRGFSSGRVCPVLVDLEAQELTGPLADFQVSSILKDDMHKLVSAINRAANEFSIDNSRLSRLFEAIWPELETAVNQVLLANADKHKATEKEAPSSRTFQLLASRGSLINPADRSRNVSFKVDSINTVFESLAESLRETSGEDAARTAFADAGRKMAQSFGERIAEQWGIEYPDASLNDLISKWCAFDSDVGFGRLVNELNSDSDSDDLHGAIRLVDNFQVYKRTGRSHADCSLMHGYIEGVLEAFTSGFPVRVECDKGECPLTRRMKRDCVFNVTTVDE